MGDLPDGQPFYRETMAYATPTTTNSGASVPRTVWINEWMAANTSASGLADPADGNFEDWFELYNPGPSAVDLGGCFLTDNLTNQFQFEIPNNGHYLLPPGGYLLVWADGEAGQNSTNQPDLHVNFNLRAAGEAIGLFAPDGTTIDAVTFGQQTNNVSMGRVPDGGANVFYLPEPSPRAANRGAPPAPNVTQIVVSGPTVTLTFVSQPGQRYRAQYKDELAAPAWTDLPAEVVATGANASLSDTHHGTQRFYRVRTSP